MENVIFCFKVFQDFWFMWMIYFVIFLNVILSVIVILGNIVIFVVFGWDNQFYMLIRFFFCFLVLMDFGVGFILQFCFVIYFFLVVIKRLNDCERIESVMQVFIVFFCSILFCILIVVSIDRFFFFKLGLRYRCVVIVK